MLELKNKTIVSTMSSKGVKGMLDTGKIAKEVIKEYGLGQVSNADEIEPIVKKVIENNQKAVNDYKGGKKTAVKSLIGQVMKETKGKANPQIVQELLTKLLDKS